MMRDIIFYLVGWTVFTWPVLCMVRVFNKKLSRLGTLVLLPSVFLWEAFNIFFALLTK